MQRLCSKVNVVSTRLKAILKNDNLMVMIPGILYAVALAVTYVSLSANTSRPDYTEDYSGLNILVVPFFAFAHYSIGSVIGLLIMVVSKLRGKSIEYVRCLWIALWGMAITVLVVGIVGGPVARLIRFGHL
jgi:hypothetical protein